MTSFWRSPTTTKKLRFFSYNMSAHVESMGYLEHMPARHFESMPVYESHWTLISIQPYRFCRQVVLHGLFRHLDSSTGFLASSPTAASRSMAQGYCSRRLDRVGLSSRWIKFDWWYDGLVGWKSRRSYGLALYVLSTSQIYFDLSIRTPPTRRQSSQRLTPHVHYTTHSESR